MGRGRKGLVISSQKQMRQAITPLLLSRIGHRHEESVSLSPQDVEAAKGLTKEQLAYILFKENERPLTKIAEVTVYLRVQPLTPHEQSLAWATIKQIVHNGLFWFYNNLFNVVDFQRPDWVSRSPTTPFQFTRLVQISHIDLGSELFLV